MCLHCAFNDEYIFDSIPLQSCVKLYCISLETISIFSSAINLVTTVGHLYSIFCWFCSSFVSWLYLSSWCYSSIHAFISNLRMQRVLIKIFLLLNPTVDLEVGFFCLCDVVVWLVLVFVLFSGRHSRLTIATRTISSDRYPKSYRKEMQFCLGL